MMTRRHTLLIWLYIFDEAKYRDALHRDGNTLLEVARQISKRLDASIAKEREAGYFKLFY